MRSRKEIEEDTRNRDKFRDLLQLEILLDIRDLLLRQIPKRKYTKSKEVKM